MLSAWSAGATTISTPRPWRRDNEALRLPRHRRPGEETSGLFPCPIFVPDRLRRRTEWVSRQAASRETQRGRRGIPLGQALLAVRFTRVREHGRDSQRFPGQQGRQMCRSKRVPLPPTQSLQGWHHVRDAHSRPAGARGSPQQYVSVVLVCIPKSCCPAAPTLLRFLSSKKQQ